MVISNIANNLIGQTQSSQSTQQATSDPVTKALKRASDRIDQQLGSTKVQLSAYGQIKSAFSDVQAAGNALSNLKKTATADDIKKAVQGFVDAYNKANKAVGTATQGDGKQAGALANDARARLAGNDLRRSVAEGGNLADLKNIGVTQNKDGTLAVDSKALDKALQANPDQVRSALGATGQQVEKAAARELANNGNVGKSVNALSNRSNNLEAQQSAQQDLLLASQRAVTQQATLINNTFASGIAAYQRTFSG